MLLLKPLSCQAMAVASEGETPWAAATDWTSAAPRRVLVGSGAAAGTTVAVGAGCEDAGGRGGAGRQLDHGPGDQQAGRVESVHRRDRVDGHTSAGGEAGERVAEADGVPAERRGSGGSGGSGSRSGRSSGGSRCGRGRSGHEPGLLQRGIALDSARHHHGAPEHDLRVLGQAVERGDGARREVVGGRDRPQRLARLHGVRHGGASRSGEENREKHGEQRSETQGVASKTGV